MCVVDLNLFPSCTESISNTAEMVIDVDFRINEKSRECAQWEKGKEHLFHPLEMLTINCVTRVRSDSWEIHVLYLFCADVYADTNIMLLIIGGVRGNFVTHITSRTWKLLDTNKKHAEIIDKKSTQTTQDMTIIQTNWHPTHDTIVLRLFECVINWIYWTTHWNHYLY